MRAEITVAVLDSVALLVLRRQDLAALLHVSGAAVCIRWILARVHTLDGVSPIRPRAEGNVAEGGDPQVVAAERHLAIVELLEVGIRHLVGDLRCNRPGGTTVGRSRCVHIERGDCRAVPAVHDPLYPRGT